MKRGTFSYNETLYDIFSKEIRHFSFKTCPYLCDSKLRVYNASNVLSISGPTLSGKTLLISHIIFDLITSTILAGKIVLIDTELSFDYETLMSKFDSQDSDGNEDYIDQCLSNLLYLPVRNHNEFLIILNSLDICLRNGSLKVHALLIDSMTNLSTRIFSDDMKISSNTPNISVTQIIDFCQRHSIFLIYTSDLEINMKKTEFSVVLKTPENEVTENTTVEQNDQVEVLSPTCARDNAMDFNHPVTDLLVSFESNNSNDYKTDFEEKLEMCKVGTPNSYNGEEVEYTDVDSKNNMRIRSFIPEAWITNDLRENYRNKISILLSFSRTMDKKYITFMSKDYRFQKEENGTKAEKTEVNELETENLRSKRGLEREVGAEALINHDFRVYRIDSAKTYTKCSYELQTPKFNL